MPNSNNIGFQAFVSESENSFYYECRLFFIAEMSQRFLMTIANFWFRRITRSSRNHFAKNSWKNSPYQSFSNKSIF